jgi:hypothetical protein
MKRYAIGDTHGRNYWKEFINDDFDEFYFLGDYFDTRDGISVDVQISNFKEICSLAETDLRIKLCVGNHDFHYMKGVSRNEQYSGYQFYKRFDIQEVLCKYEHLLNVVYLTEDNYLLSHAGVTKTFLKVVNRKVEELNQLFIENKDAFVFDGFDCYGDDPINGPLWVRPKSLMRDVPDEYKQIVGHTQYDDITSTTNGQITFCDCLGTRAKVHIF